MKSDDSKPLLKTVAALGLIASGLAAIYTGIVAVSGFVNFSSEPPYFAILIVVMGLFINIRLLLKSHDDVDPKDTGPLLLASVVITLVIIVPIVSAGLDLNPHTGR